ncbi:Acetyltransferase (GNAT) family protein [Pseudodesulfovibrio hydrargyri]|uniref:Acetyltransferase (GNAT) family protein n=1 Tax=Pseudodesulfovibrio hydrargyri TaxID=2125990 RepID=A0A1J5MYY4_9BACT|nr:GNAT family N-acetyltransferase [Pseudodesulfovibrio hydrargyri]OIQ51662.1 Acetyltransferase (GNAT) family protein [Pseudodesulfovibrio hydrargyri]
MDLRIENDCAGVDWQAVADILKEVGMAHHAPGVHAKAFKASHTTVFVYDGDRLIGFGRALSDGAYQAAIYDCAVLPEYQGHRLGTRIMDAVLAGVGDCNVILYAAPGKEGFYRKQGFSRMKTGMARFANPDAMRDKGFIE